MTLLYKRISLNNKFSIRLSFYFLFVLCFIDGSKELSRAQTTNQFADEKLEAIGIDERLGQTVDLSVKFALSNGDSVLLSDLLEEGKPIVLNPVYYECPMLCGLVLNGLLKSASNVDWTPGKEYNIITFSINPEEKHELASQNRTSYIDSLGRTDALNGWYFLTGTQENITKLTNSIGFRFFYDELNKQYSHPASLVILSPEGVITRYLYGIEYEPIQFKKALSEAVNGEIGSTVDKIILYCFSYDPDLNSYVPEALQIMKLGGVVIMLGLGLFLGILWFKEKFKTT
ncbi:SCO family protein [bacterium]|nr:MAG: SCO family protein [bacterium]